MELIKHSGLMNQACPWLDREWLETDGAGGYAGMTVPLCCTRKYHGLLVTGIENHEGRYVLLAGYEILVQDESGGSYRLDTNQYPGSFYPSGFTYLEKFDNRIFPCWTFRAGEIVLSVEIFMRENSAVYLVVGSRNRKAEARVNIVLSPVISYRDSHSLTRENSYINFSIEENDGVYAMNFYDGMPRLFFMANRETVFTEKNVWLKNREYFREMERGFDYHEDSFVPGSFSFSLDQGDPLILRAGTGYEYSGRQYLGNVYDEERIKRESIRRMHRGEPAVIRTLKQGSRHFIVKNSRKESSIIAGYPWFGEWGRDTMISLPGLTACCGNVQAGSEILKSYAKYIREGLVPNTLGGAQGFESYNSIDAGLLYVRAAQYLLENGKVKKQDAKDIFSAVMKITKACLDGNVPGLSVLENGFPEAGNSETQLTWMDAKSFGHPVTPRGGSPVEITALFYNALRFYCDTLAANSMEQDKKAEDTAERIEKNFKDAYWIGDGGYLADVVYRGRQDRSLRPNMLFALALPYPLVDREAAKSVIEITEAKLLTRAGLRTLSPDDSRFCPVYQGSGEMRDSCYHQGTVWPWLFGIYTDAALYAADDKKAKAQTIEKALLAFLESHIDENGIGFVSEIFDGLNQYEGKGAYAQAWSSAEIIRAWDKVRKTISGENRGDK